MLYHHCEFEIHIMIIIMIITEGLHTIHIGPVTKILAQSNCINVTAIKSEEAVAFLIAEFLQRVLKGNLIRTSKFNASY